MEKIVSLAFANWQYITILFLPYFSYMIYDFMQDGMIFSWFGNWLRKEENLNKIIDEKIKIAIIENEDLKVIKKIESEKIKIPFYKKPLGQCLKCFHIWICIIFIMAYVDFLFFTNIKILIAISLSYSVLVKEYYK